MASGPTPYGIAANATPEGRAILDAVNQGRAVADAAYFSESGGTKWRFVARNGKAYLQYLGIANGKQQWQTAQAFAAAPSGTEHPQ